MLVKILENLPLCRVRDLPRRLHARLDDSDISRRQRSAALMAAYFEKAPVAFGWHRAAQRSEVELFVGGRALLRSDGDDAVPLNFPPGASGERLQSRALLASLVRLESWISIAAAVDVAPDDMRLDQDRVQRPSLEDCLVGVWDGPFGWLALALPVPTTTIDYERNELALRIPALRSKAINSQEAAAELKREETWYGELNRGRLAGIWRVHLLVGGATPEAAIRLGSLFAGSADLAQLPYLLRPDQTARPLPDWLHDTAEAGPGWSSGMTEARRVGGSPFEASTEFLAALGKGPRREIRGVRLRLRPDFDVTPEELGNLPLGDILDQDLVPNGSLGIPLPTLNRHAFVCGATGFGKSQTVRHLLEELSRSKPPIPWLVVEPAKAEYRAMAARLRDHAQVVVIRPGNADAIAAGLNPLAPEPGFPLQTHLDLIKDLFLAAFEAEEPFPQIVNAALTRCYEEQGWDLALSESRVRGVAPRYPNLEDLQRTAKALIGEIDYGREVKQNVMGYVDVRLRSLRLGTPGRFLQGGHPVDLAALLRSNVVLELEDVGDDRDKAFLMGTILVRLCEHLRVRGRRPLQHVTIVEEAHRLLRRTVSSGSAAHAVEQFAALLAEVRAYGEGIVVVEQIPSKITTDVIKNSALKIVHRLPARDDRDAVGNTMNLDEAQSAFAVSLRPGAAVVATDGMDYPVLIQVPLSEHREHGHATFAEAPMAERFSPACGQLCREASACTLRDMVLAKRALQDDPRLALWAELVVVAHLIGMVSPRPLPSLLDDLRGLDRRTAECAVAHAVDAAISCRSATLWRHFTPADLATHVAAVLRGQLADVTLPCSPEEWRWCAGPFRWNHLRRELRQWREGGHAEPYPTADWRDRFGVRLDATTSAEQEALLIRLSDERAAERATVLFGAMVPSAIEQSVGSRWQRPEWEQRLRAALAPFAFDFPWPLAYLAPRPPTAAQVQQVKRAPDE